MQRLKDIYARNSPTQQCDREPQPQGVKQLLQVSCCYLHPCHRQMYRLCVLFGSFCQNSASVSVLPCPLLPTLLLSQSYTYCVLFWLMLSTRQSSGNFGSCTMCSMSIHATVVLLAVLKVRSAEQGYCCVLLGFSSCCATGCIWLSAVSLPKRCGCAISATSLSSTAAWVLWQALLAMLASANVAGE